MYRTERGWSPSELAKKAGLSVSYLNEIEKGKKYPKEAKIHSLAAALSLSFEELTSSRLGKSMAPLEALLRSNFLNELPLDIFGIELSKVVEIIAEAPTHVGAFISTLVELARLYAVREENFYLAAMRAYQELHNNYFEELEKAVDTFALEHSLPLQARLEASLLEDVLERAYHIQAEFGGLDAYDELRHFRALYLPNKGQLLLRGNLTPSQRALQVAKELGFQYLELKERSYTSSLLKITSFEQVLNHFKATYFAVALLVRKELLVPDIKAFFECSKWEGNAMLDLLHKYQVSPETLFHRFSNLLPGSFGIENLFFLRMIHETANDRYVLDKELHLNKAHQPHRSGLGLHYCRRWLSIGLLREMQQLRSVGREVNTMVGVQHSRYYGTEDTYLCLSLARLGYPRPGHNAVITMGILWNEDMRSKVRFGEDQRIRQREVNLVCERCPIQDCQERAHPPRLLEQRQQRRRMMEQVNSLLAKE